MRLSAARSGVLLLLAALTGAGCRSGPADVPGAPPDRFDGIPEGDAVVAAQLPTLDAVLEGDARGQAILHQYARQALYPQAVQTPAHLGEVFALRDSVIAHLHPRVEPFFIGQDDFAVADRFVAEARRAGLEPLVAEGMLLGVGPGALLPARVETLGTPGFKRYARFREAHARAQSGEYPFLDLEPTRQMVLLGEQLLAAPSDSVYFAAIRAEFEQALLRFVSLHQSGGAWFVGPATSDYYPWAATDSAHRAFQAGNADSRYHAAVAAILENPPVAEGESLDAVVVAMGREDAMRAGVLDALHRGVDLTAVLPLDEEHTAFGAVYRYFPAGDQRAVEAARAARGAGLPATIQTIPRPGAFDG